MITLRRPLIAPLAIALLALTAANCPAQDDPAKKAPLKTTGPVAEATLQVGTWTPLETDTPPWIFPMVYLRWHAGRDTAEEYARRAIEEIESRPKDQPIWLQTNGWFGNYKPRDTENILAHKGDFTPQGTAGIWPEKGIELWDARQRTFLKMLRDAGCRLDAWPFDNETKVHKWSRNFKGEDVFLNMVRDPRWEDTAIKGVWLPGRRFVSRKTIEEAENPNDLAHAWIRPLAIFMRDWVVNEHFAKPIYEFYPHAWVSDYGRYPNKHGGMYGAPEIVARIKQTAGHLERIRGVGNAHAVVLYGGRDDDANRVELMLAKLDQCIEAAGGPERVTPWLAMPNQGLYKYNWTTKEITVHPERRRFTKEEWTRMVVECARRGIRKFLIWNTVHNRHENLEAEKTLVEAFRKAEAVAKERMAGE